MFWSQNREVHKIRETDLHDVVKIFALVSRFYPAHAMIQGVAMVRFCRVEGISLKKLKLLTSPDAINSINEILERIRNHKNVERIDINEVVKANTYWAQVSWWFSDAKIDQILDEYWQHYKNLRDTHGYDTAIDNSVIFLLVKVFPIQKYHYIFLKYFNDWINDEY